MTARMLMVEQQRRDYPRAAVTPVSRFPWSPCRRVRFVDFVCHRYIPLLLRRRAPGLSRKLLQESPRWGWRANGQVVSLHGG